ncbi:MAG: 3-deoxy-manno-octulosonate cytidylyltransferase [Candidatus Omnitrophica bacterium]|nr:3-deoxy-manno-octulosonate cytidylyltransferase [Candidatus Omnitrophota bacterium]
MKVIAVIPARWESSRFKGKVLADINGKSMLERVWERVKMARNIDDVIVAVDKEKVARAVEAFGGKAVYTAPEQPSGTDRIAEAMNSLDADVVVNVQADEPLIEPQMIEELAQVFEYEKSAQMATLIKRIHRNEDISDPNVVKVVVDRKGYALYFSRSPIPYIRDKEKTQDDPGGSYFKHIGIYSYTKEFLYVYTHMPKSMLECAEKLEQLRVLEHGYKIRTIETRYDTVGVDTPEDLERVRELLKK